MAYSALEVADYVLRRQADKGITLTPMQLIKIVYLCHGWHLGVTREPLINEPVEAWAYGPVVRSVYDKYKKFGSGAIEAPETSPDIAPDKAEIIDTIADYYSQFSGIRLSKLTHLADSPWDVTWRIQGKNAVISDDLIEEYYSKQASTDGQQQTATA